MKGAGARFFSLLILFAPMHRDRQTICYPVNNKISVQFEFLNRVQSAVKNYEFCNLYSMVVRNVLTMLSLGKSLKLWER